MTRLSECVTYRYRCDACGTEVDTHCDYPLGRDAVLDRLDWVRRGKRDLCRTCADRPSPGAKACGKCGATRKLLGKYCLF